MDNCNASEYYDDIGCEECNACLSIALSMAKKRLDPTFSERTQLSARLHWEGKVSLIAKNLDTSPWYDEYLTPMHEDG